MKDYLIRFFICFTSCLLHWNFIIGHIIYMICTVISKQMTGNHLVLKHSKYTTLMWSKRQTEMVLRWLVRERTDVKSWWALNCKRWLCIIVTHHRTVKAEPAAACLTCSSPIHPPPVYPKCIKQPEKAAGLAAGQLNSLLMQTQACFQRW